MGGLRGPLRQGVQILALFWDPGLTIDVPYAALLLVRRILNVPRLSWMDNAPQCPPFRPRCSGVPFISRPWPGSTGHPNVHYCPQGTGFFDLPQPYSPQPGSPNSECRLYDVSLALRASMYPTLPSGAPTTALPCHSGSQMLPVPPDMSTSSLKCIRETGSYPRVWRGRPNLEASVGAL